MEVQSADCVLFITNSPYALASVYHRCEYGDDCHDRMIALMRAMKFLFIIIIIIIIIVIWVDVKVATSGGSVILRGVHRVGLVLEGRFVVQTRVGGTGDIASGRVVIHRVFESNNIAVIALAGTSVSTTRHDDDNNDQAEEQTSDGGGNDDEVCTLEYPVRG